MVYDSLSVNNRRYDLVVYKALLSFVTNIIFFFFYETTEMKV